MKIHLGCGDSKQPGYIGIDLVKHPCVDKVHDLDLGIPYPDNSVDAVEAVHVLEHLKYQVQIMNEIWRVCKHGAKVHIIVPSTEGRGAFQDPSHKTWWNLNTFFYYGRCSDPAHKDMYGKWYSKSPAWTGFKGLFIIRKLQNKKMQHNVINVEVFMDAHKGG